MTKSNFSPYLQNYDNPEYNTIKYKAYLIDCYIKLILDTVVGFGESLLPKQLQSEKLNNSINQLLACFASMVRSQKAKHYFCNKGKYDSNKSVQGEVDFRMIAILNACYIQCDALTASLKLIDYASPKELTKKMHKCEIIKYRARCAGHNSSYGKLPVRILDETYGENITYEIVDFKEDEERSGKESYPNLIKEWDELICGILKDNAKIILDPDRQHLVNIQDINYKKLLDIRNKLDQLLNSENTEFDEPCLNWPSRSAKPGMLAIGENKNNIGVPFFGWDDYTKRQ